MIFEIFAYITGGLIVILSLFNFMFRSKKTTLILKASIDIIAVLNALFIFLYTKETLVLAGLVTCGIGFIRDVLFFFRNDVKWLNNFAWPIGFACLFLLSGIFTYRGPVSLLPIIGSPFSTISLYLNDQRYTKTGSLICLGCYTAYYAILLPSSGILTIFSLASSIMNIIGCTIGLIHLHIYRHREDHKDLL